MSISIRDTRLLEDLALMQTLQRESSFITFTTKGSPPDAYTVTLTCKGIASQDVVTEFHKVRIHLRADYPYDPPLVRWITPIFHPNIQRIGELKIENDTGQVRSVREVVSEIEEYGEDVPEDYQNLDESKVCLDILEWNWTPKVTLDKLCIELAEIAQYKKYNLDDPLNAEAILWARRNIAHFPIDKREIRDGGSYRTEENDEDLGIRFLD